MKSLSKIRTCIAVFVFTLVADQVYAQDYRIGTCPYQRAQPNFNYTAYNGIWYEQLKFPNILQNGYKCDMRVYLAVPGLIEVVHTRYSNFWGPNVQTGTMYTSGSPAEAKFTVRYPSLWNAPHKYWVLQTDYESYSINWACSDIPGIVNRQYLWVYTRKKNPGGDFLADMRGKIAYKGLATGSLVQTTQDCLL